MVEWFDRFIDFYSTNGTMNDIQLVDTIEIIREEYPHYTQEDFKLFFKQAKKGYFGETYGRIDGDVIIKWLRKYDISRDKAAQDIAIREQEKYKSLVKVDNYLSGISYEEYLEIKKRANEGDEDAINQLKPPSEREQI